MNHTTVAAEKAKLIHMPARCQYIAWSASARYTGWWYCHSREYSATASAASNQACNAGRIEAPTATTGSSNEIAGLVTPPVK